MNKLVYKKYRRKVLGIISYGILSILIILGAFIFNKASRVDAQVSIFYPTVCLGGWANTDKAEGSPDSSGDATNFSDENSASLSDSSSQIFCGGFSGEIPENARHNRVVLSISFGTEKESEVLEEEVFLKEEIKPREEEDTGAAEGQSFDLDDGEGMLDEAPLEDAPKEDAELEGEVLGDEAPTVGPVQEDDPGTIEEGVILNLPEEESPVEDINEDAPESEEPPLDSGSSEESVSLENPSFWKKILPVAYAEEETNEIIKSDEVPPGSVFEIKYTLDGKDWSSLGYVSDISSVAVFDLPIGVFVSIDDLKRMQISVETIPTVDSLPKIYLDAMWLDIEYSDPVSDPLVPPGELPGDVILREIPYENMTAVLVERHPEDGDGLLELWMYVFAEETAFVETPIAQEVTQEESTEELTAEIFPEVNNTSSSEESATVEDLAVEKDVPVDSIQDLVAPTDPELDNELLVNVIEETRKKIWVKIAGDELLSRTPNVTYIEGSVYWIGSGDSTVWRFNPSSNSFESTSFNPGETGKLYIYDREDGSKFVERQSDGSIKMKEVKKLNNGT